MWALFAAGGTLTALLFPALIVLFLMVSTGNVPPGLEYDSVRGFVGGWPGRIALFIVVGLAAWHAAHRFRVLAHDFGIRSDAAVAIIGYGLAAAATVLAAVLPMMVPS